MPDVESDKDKGDKKKIPGKIISFSDLKKKNEPESG